MMVRTETTRCEPRPSGRFAVRASGVPSMRQAAIRVWNTASQGGTRG